MQKITVMVPYIGGVLSKNDYKLPTRGTKPIVKKWKNELANRIRTLRVLNVIPNGYSYRIGIRGHFLDERRPDIQNLFEVVSDAAQMGLDVNDKYFTMVDNGYETGYLEPELVITIEKSG